MYEGITCTIFCDLPSIKSTQIHKKAKRIETYKNGHFATVKFCAFIWIVFSETWFSKKKSEMNKLSNSKPYHMIKVNPFITHIYHPDFNHVHVCNNFQFVVHVYFNLSWDGSLVSQIMKLVTMWFFLVSSVHIGCTSSDAVGTRRKSGSGTENQRPFHAIWGHPEG